MEKRPALDELFEPCITCPDCELQERLARLVGLDDHKERLAKILGLLGQSGQPRSLDEKVPSRR